MGLAGKPRDRADIADRAFDAVADHQLDRFLHQEEGPANIGREHPVEKLGGRVQDRPAIGQRAGIHQHMHMAEASVRFGDHTPAILDRAKVGAQEQNRRPIFGRDAVRHCLAALLVTAGDDDSRRAGCRETAGDCRTEPLRCACSHADFAVHPVHSTTSYPANAITRMSSLCPFFAIS